MAEPLPIWVIYQNPTDRPGLFVARKWLLDKATEELFEATTLQMVRDQLPTGLTCLPRSPMDDPVIVESWV